MDTQDPLEVYKCLYEKGEMLRISILINSLQDILLKTNNSKTTYMFINLRQLVLIILSIFVLNSGFGLAVNSLYSETEVPEFEPKIDESNFLISRPIEEVTIIAKKKEPETEIFIQPPYGKKFSYLIESDTIKWLKSDNFDMLSIKNPTVGLWKILFSLGKKNKAYIIKNIRVMTTDDNLTFPMGKSIDIESWLEHDEGIIIKPDILNKIKLIYEITKPDGKTLKLLPFAKEKGAGSENIAGVFTHLFDPKKRGTYQVKITAQASTFKKVKTFSFKVTVPKKHAKSENENETKTNSPESVKIAATPSIKNKASSEKHHDESDQPEEIHWAGEIMKFLLINFTLFIAGFGYFKRRDIIRLTQSVLKRGNSDKG